MDLRHETLDNPVQSSRNPETQMFPDDHVYPSVLTSGGQSDVPQTRQCGGEVNILQHGTVGPRQDSGLRNRECKVESNTDGKKENCNKCGKPPLQNQLVDGEWRFGSAVGNVALLSVSDGRVCLWVAAFILVIHFQLLGADQCVSLCFRNSHEVRVSLGDLQYQFKYPITDDGKN